MNREDIMKSGRRAGEVLRYHAWQVLRAQSVAEHTWQVLRIFYQIFDQLPEEIAVNVLWHDAGELRIGDLPFPVKSQNPDLKAVCDRLEEETVAIMAGSLPRLDSLDRNRIKLCDLLEMVEFGNDEVMRGNQFAQPIVVDCIKAAASLPIGDGDWQAVFDYLERSGQLSVNTQLRIKRRQHANNKRIERE